MKNAILNLLTGLSTKHGDCACWFGKNGVISGPIGFTNYCKGNTKPINFYKFNLGYCMCKCVCAERAIPKRRCRQLDCPDCDVVAQCFKKSEKRCNFGKSNFFV